MAKLPINYRTSPPIVSTFSFEDIASGLGFITFFGIASKDDSGLDYHIITNKELWSQVPMTDRASNGTTTLDFDSSTLNLQRTAKGTAYFSAGVGAAEPDDVKLQVQIKKVDADSNVTNITSEITSNTFESAAGNLSDMIFLELPITQTIIKVGEFIRLTVKLVGVSVGTKVEVGHDPKNQDGSYIKPGTINTTIMTLLMPFKLPI